VPPHRGNNKLPSAAPDKRIKRFLSMILKILNNS
jgi:hypothetical protein